MGTRPCGCRLVRGAQRASLRSVLRVRGVVQRAAAGGMHQVARQLGSSGAQRRYESMRVPQELMEWHLERHSAGSNARSAGGEGGTERRDDAPGDGAHHAVDGGGHVRCSLRSECGYPKPLPALSLERVEVRRESTLTRRALCRLSPFCGTLLRYPSASKALQCPSASKALQRPLASKALQCPLASKSAAIPGFPAVVLC